MKSQPNKSFVASYPDKNNQRICQHVVYSHSKSICKPSAAYMGWFHPYAYHMQDITSRYHNICSLFFFTFYLVPAWHADRLRNNRKQRDFLSNQLMLNCMLPLIQVKPPTNVAFSQFCWHQTWNPGRMSTLTRTNFYTKPAVILWEQQDMASPLSLHHKSLTHTYWIYPLSLRLLLKCASG